MAYGNVTPPPLPEYDSGTYGFYLLVFNYEKDAEDWYMVHLIYSAWRFHYEEGVGVTNTTVTFTRTYSEGSWTEEMQNTETLALNPGLGGVVYQRIYTNANIFNGDEIWLAENTVTPVETEKFPIKDFLNGFIMALCGRTVQWPKREPVAFLYGPDKVRLPDIYKVYTPEIRETHPYALIIYYQYDDGSSLSYLQVFSKPLTTIDLTDQYGYVSVQVLEDGGTYMEWQYRSDEYTDWMGANIPITSDTWGTRITRIRWANTPIYNPDGSLCIKESVPVPVYE